MRTLFIMRHCKSRWDDPEVDDHERGLAKRGKRDARLVGQALAERLPPPDVILSSSARRACGTARRVARAWGYSGKILQKPALYSGGPLQYLQALRPLSDSVVSVLLVGHNPALENLIWALGLPRLAMPTGAIVCLDLKMDHWDDLGLTTVAQVRFRLEPKELRAADASTAV